MSPGGRKKKGEEGALGGVALAFLTGSAAREGKTERSREEEPRSLPERGPTSPEPAAEALRGAREERAKPAIDRGLLERAKRAALEQPRVSFFSPAAAAALAFLAATEPGFSMSNYVRRVVEAALQRDYPELWERVRGIAPRRRVRARIPKVTAR